MMLEKFIERARRSLLAAACLGAVVVAGTAVDAGEPTQPRRGVDKAETFVAALGDKAVVILGPENPGVSTARLLALRELIRDSFSLETTGQFVLGKYWNRASAEQRAEFLDLFTEYLLNNYAYHLSTYKTRAMVIVGSNALGNDIFVETEIEHTRGLTTAVWRVRRLDGGYKIIDMVIDGVSLALTHRREFATVVNRSGMPGLLKVLREKVAAGAKTAQNRPPALGSHISLLAGILGSPKDGARSGLLLTGF